MTQDIATRAGSERSGTLARRSSIVTLAAGEAAPEHLPGRSVSPAADGVAPTVTGRLTAEQIAASRRRAGRRAISVSLLLIGVFAMVSGFWGLLLPRGSFALPVHVAAGSVFGLLSLVHVLYNWNAVRLYLRDLGWPPAVLKLLIAVAIAGVLLVPALRHINP